MLLYKILFGGEIILQKRGFLLGTILSGNVVFNEKVCNFFFETACILFFKDSGERGIRTPGPVTVNGFQDRRIRPLCHLSSAKIHFEILRLKKINGLLKNTRIRNEIRGAKLPKLPNI